MEKAFVILERMKQLRCKEVDIKHYFLRTCQQQEIDLIEETAEGLTAVECKWIHQARVRFPQTFTENYSGSKTLVITPGNIEEIIGVWYQVVFIYIPPMAGSSYMLRRVVAFRRRTLGGEFPHVVAVRDFSVRRFDYLDPGNVLFLNFLIHQLTTNNIPMIKEVNIIIPIIQSCRICGRNLKIPCDPTNHTI
jgi:hypothetical protein